MYSFINLLKTLQIFYKTAHLVSRGPTGYSDHLLFQKLYTGMDEAIDNITELTIANEKSLSVTEVLPSLTEILSNFEGFEEQAFGLKLFVQAFKLESEYYDQGRILLSNEISDGQGNAVQELLEDSLRRQYLLNQRFTEEF